MYQRLAAFLLVVLIMIHSIRSAAIESTTSSNDDSNDLFVRNAQGGIDLACTTKCAEW